MVLATRPRQDDIKHHLPDSADVSVVRGDRLLRLRTICATREDAERTFLVFTFTYGLGAGRAARVGEAPGGAVWEAPVTAVGRDARVCMSCDRYVPIFDRCVDANNICMACMLAGRGPQRPPVPFATPRHLVAVSPAPPVTAVTITATALQPDAGAHGDHGDHGDGDAQLQPALLQPRTATRRRRGGRRHGGGRGPDRAGAGEAGA